MHHSITIDPKYFDGKLDWKTLLWKYIVVLLEERPRTRGFIRVSNGFLSERKCLAGQDLTEECVFPVKYNRRTYWWCSMADHGESWCAVSTNKSRTDWWVACPKQCLGYEPTIPTCPTKKGKVRYSKEKALLLVHLGQSTITFYFDLMTVFRRVSSPLFGKVTSIVSAPRTITRNPGVPLPLTSKVASEAGMLATVHAQVCILFENSKNSII